MSKDILEKFNWDEGNGKIKELAIFESMRFFLNEYKDIQYLKQEIENRGLKYDIESIVIDFFENITNEFKTQKSEVVLYNHTYKLDDTNNIFFWENENSEVFYIRPKQMIDIFETSISTIVNRLFTDSICIKEMSDEEDNKYFELLASSEDKANTFRKQFYTSLDANSGDDIFKLATKYILDSISSSFEMRINRRNHNGNIQLKDEIIKKIEELKSQYRLS